MCSEFDISSKAENECRQRLAAHLSCHQRLPLAVA
jgi:hypothetical protein